MKKILIIVVIGIVLAGIGISGQHQYFVNTSFSPQEVWTKNISASDGVVYNAEYTPDSNSDGKAEIRVITKNLTASQYTLILLNGDDGSEISRKVFMDVGYSENGDQVVIDPSVYGMIVLDEYGNFLHKHEYVIFVNRSDTSHISVYSLNYPSYSVKAYEAIILPSTINYGTINVPVSSHAVRFDVEYINGEVYLLSIIYSYGEYYGYGFYQINIYAYNESLTTIWQKEYKGATQPGYPVFGVDILEFNGRGVNGDYGDLAIVNLSANPGNTTIEILDSATGNLLWNTTLKGVVLISNPITALSLGKTYDYDRDGYTDFVIPTFVTNGNLTYLNFVSSSGNLMGYYVTKINNFTTYAIFTDEVFYAQHINVQTLDVNGDGYGEFFFVDNNSKIVCWDIYANTTVWVKQLTDTSYNYTIFLSTNDIDSDDTPDVYLMGYKDYQVESSYRRDVILTGINGAQGNTLYTASYCGLVTGMPGTTIKKEITDINGDSLQDSLLGQGYYNDGSGVYIYVLAVSMRDGSIIWNATVYTDLNNNDFANWTSQLYFGGDINGDGTNDVFAVIYYQDPATSKYTTYLRILSGTDGSLLWEGVVSEDDDSTDLLSFAFIKSITGWHEFDYNEDGITNEILITTSSSIHIYAVVGGVPEISIVYLYFVVMPAAVWILRRNR